jgi:hypothetical protein
VARLRHPPGPLGRLRQRLQDPRPGLHGIGHVGLQDPVGQGSGLPGLPRPLVLLARRHPAVGHRDQDGRRLPRPAGPGRHRRAAAVRGRRSGRRLGPDLDDHAVDAAVQPRDGGQPGRRLRAGRGEGRALRPRRRPPRRVRPELGEEPNVLRTFPGTELLGLSYTPPFDFFVGRAQRAPRARRRLRHHRRRHRPRPHRARVR